MNNRSFYSAKSGFSLIEILVVMAIMTILAFIAMPSLVGVNSSGQLSAAGNLVVDLANQARQNSITQNAMTALVMVNGSTTHPEWNNRLFVLMELAPASSSGTPPSWTPVSKWEMLPPGVVVDPSFSSFMSQSPTLATSLPSLSYLGTSIPSSDCAYQVFLSTGGLLSPSAAVNAPPILRLVTGAMNGTVATYRGAQTAGSPDNYYNVTINPYTGMLKVTRP
jgi:prepilin-type N-terminal cleavage/methylation domain-containing protein